MSTNPYESHECDDKTVVINKMNRQTAENNKFTALLPVDAENYMLRGIGRPANLPNELQPLENLSSPSTLQDMATDVASTSSGPTSYVLRDKDVYWDWGTNDDSVDVCARIYSYHHLLCSCNMTCCCNCNNLCSADCHACLHNCCLRYSADYPCQKDNDLLPPVTLDYDKVSLQNLFSIIYQCFIYIKFKIIETQRRAIF